MAGLTPFWRAALARAFDRSFWVFFVLCCASGLGCWLLRGREVVLASLASDALTLGLLTPKVAAASVVAALVPLLLPREAVSRWLGRGSGLRGVALAALAGSLMPGGPMTSFPLVASLRAAGAGPAVLVAFLTAWSVLGLQRIVMWEIPLMGPEFVALRLAVSAPLPFIAAALASAILAAAQARSGVGGRS